MAGRGRGRGKSGVQFVQNDEPSFIKQFKERVGYKEGPNVDTKRQQLDCGPDEDAPEMEDEQPVVVVLKGGDLTAEEADHTLKEQETTANSVENIVTEGKITFKKPSKRSGEAENTADLSASTSAKKKKDSDDKKSITSSVKKTKNSSLLSFGDDEEEED